MEFRFAYPLALSLLALLAIFIVPRLARWRPQPGLMQYSDTRLFAGLPVSVRARLYWLPDALRLLAWVLLVFALARPQTGNQIEVLRGRGIDMVLALDISGSMAALDFEPLNRLEAAKMVMADFIDERKFDRIGLAVFARTAYHQAPLTLDYDVLATLLDEVRMVTDLRGGAQMLDGTAIGLGIASSANLLRDDSTPSRVIILLTDGANNAGLDPILAAEAAAALGIRIYTIGMGAPGMMAVPTSDGDIQMVESDLDEDVLRQIADIGGGLYFRADDTPGLRQIYRQINTLERSDVERRVRVRWQDRAAGLLVAALLLMLLERGLRRTVLQTVP
ncbi:MAG: vWA domain-containing protein [Phototrophicaceae bacterium]